MHSTISVHCKIQFNIMHGQCPKLKLHSSVAQPQRGPAGGTGGPWLSSLGPDVRTNVGQEG